MTYQTFVVVLPVAFAFKASAKFLRAWVAHSIVILAGTAKIWQHKSNC
jgi:hypothetical protein